MPYYGTQLRSLLFGDFSMLWTRFQLRIPTKYITLCETDVSVVLKIPASYKKDYLSAQNHSLEKIYWKKIGIIQISPLHKHSSSGTKYLLEGSLRSAFLQQCSSWLWVSSHSADYFREIFIQPCLLKHLLFSITISLQVLLGIVLCAFWSNHLHLSYICTGKVQYCSLVCAPDTHSWTQLVDTIIQFKASKS